MSEIVNYIETYFGIRTHEIGKISDFFEAQSIEKDSYLLKQGKYQSNLSFIRNGYVRIFNIDPNSGKEITQWISTPGTLVADAACLFFNKPARFDIQTLTDCELYTISQDDFSKIGDHVKNWNHLEKMFMAKCFNMLEDRVYSHLSMTSEERYAYFFRLNPELFNQVPLQYIASMLGMTPETFSRIRKKLSS